MRDGSHRRNPPRYSLKDENTDATVETNLDIHVPPPVSGDISNHINGWKTIDVGKIVMNNDIL